MEGEERPGDAVQTRYLHPKEEAFFLPLSLAMHSMPVPRYARKCAAVLAEEYGLSKAA